MLIFLQASFIDSLYIYAYNYDNLENTWNKFWSNDSDLKLQKKNHFFNSKIAINIELLEKAMAAHSGTLAWVCVHTFLGNRAMFLPKECRDKTHSREERQKDPDTDTLVTKT